MEGELGLVAQLVSDIHAGERIDRSRMKNTYVLLNRLLTVNIKGRSGIQMFFLSVLPAVTEQPSM